MLYSIFTSFSSQTVQPGIRNSVSAAALFFGPETGRARSIPDRDQFEGSTANISPNSPRTRKRERDAATNGLHLDLPTSGPAPKRNCRSNGTETSLNGDVLQNDQNGYHNVQREPPEPASPPIYSPGEDPHTANGMDIDEDADAPGDVDDVHMTVTMTNGPSIGVQSDKVDELAPRTSMLTVPERHNIIHTAWNPRNPSILATGGEALCRLWNATKAAGFADSTDQAYHDILNPGDRSWVTSMAWSPDGQVLAVATRNDPMEGTGAVSLWTEMGKAIDDLPAAPDMVITLRWNPAGTHLLGITSSGSGTSSLAVWDTQSSYPYAPVPSSNIITDAVWTSNTTISICGHSIIASYDITWPTPSLLPHPVSMPEPPSWTHIRHDTITGVTAVAAEDTTDLLTYNSSGNLAAITAHDGELTVLAFQPLPNPSYSTNSARLLATASLDGTIKIWDARTLSLSHTLTLGHGPASPVHAMAFTPDGYLIAGGNANNVLIWKADEGGLPKASWKGELGRMKMANGHESGGGDRDSGIGEEEDEIAGPTVSLDWDAEGKKVGVGWGSQVRAFKPSRGHEELSADFDARSLLSTFDLDANASRSEYIFPLESHMSLVLSRCLRLAFLSSPFGAWETIGYPFPTTHLHDVITISPDQSHLYNYPPPPLAQYRPGATTITHIHHPSSHTAV